jgi:type IV pilus assembly protein PilE
MKSLTARSQGRGMTLVELLVVVTVVGILSAVSVPAYRQYMIRVNRTDAKRDLMQFQQKLERCFTRTNDYQLAKPDAIDACVDLPHTNPEGTYTVDFTKLDATHYTLTATPINGQYGDTRCGSMSVNQADQKTVTGTQTAQQCWSGR